MDDVKLIEVIHATNQRRGKGTEDDPVRIIEQFWSTEGKLLAENDPCPDATSFRPFRRNA